MRVSRLITAFQATGVGNAIIGARVAIPARDSSS